MEKTWFGVYNIIRAQEDWSLRSLYEFAEKLANDYQMNVHMLGFATSSAKTSKNRLQSYKLEHGVNIYITKSTPDSLRKVCRYMIENADDKKRQVFIVPFFIMPVITKLLGYYKHSEEIALITVDANIGDPDRTNKEFRGNYIQERIIKDMDVTIRRISSTQETKLFPVHIVITSGILKDLKNHDLKIEAWKEEVGMAISQMNEPYKSTTLSKYAVDWMPAVHELFKSMDEESNKIAKKL